MNMKYRISTILMSSLLLVGGLCLTACNEDELVTAPGTSLNGVTLQAFGPCPLTRGGTMEVVGSNLAKVDKVLFPKGNQRLTETKDYEEADFMVNDKGGLTVTVPNEVVPGKLRLVVGKDTLVSTTNITYDEECEVQSVSTASTDMRAGDVITITGEYVWNIASLTFANNVEVWAEDFLVNTRNEVQVAVPLAAVTGEVTYYDGNENEIQATLIENLTLRQAVYESISNDSPELGSEIVIYGKDLDLIGCANFPYVDSVEVEVNETGTELRCIVPKNTTPGDINFAQYSTVNVTVPFTPLMVEVTDVTPAEDLEAGMDVTITGTRLNLAQYILLPGGVALAPDEYSGSDTQITFTVPEGMGDGEVTVVQHENYSVLTPRIAMHHEGNVTVIWSGSWSSGNWGGNQDLAWGGYDWSTVAAGTQLVINFTLDETVEYWQMRVANGNWSALPGTTDPYELSADMTSLIITLTQDMLNVLNESGLVLTGYGFTLTQVGLMIPETVIWSGNWPSEAWGGNQELAWGGYDWSEVTAGSNLVLTFTVDESYGTCKIKLADSTWGALPGTIDDSGDADGFYTIEPDQTSLSVTLTEEMIATLINNNGLVIQANGIVLTKVSIQ